jgi:cytochrome c551/c552
MSDKSNTSAIETAVPNAGSNILLKVMGFCIGLTLVFTGVANLLPQVEGEAPVDKEIDLSALTPESFAALGEELFMGKGTCTLCHKPPPLGRAPDIQGENMVETATQRLADSRYKGKAKSATDYIRESMQQPSLYVVKGWGVAGSNDSSSPMPKVDAAPIELSSVEIDAIIAYLQHKDGNDITVELPTEAPVSDKKAEAGSGGASSGVPAPAATAEEAIKKYGCQACHNLLGTKSPVGPSLETVGSRLKAAQIQQSIIDPAAVIAKGFDDIMPKDFADKMTVKELNMIVALLVGNKGDAQ